MQRRTKFYGPVPNTKTKPAQARSNGRSPAANRKKLGNWGEEQTDLWMNTQGWQVAQKNLRIGGGEIDRIYRKEIKEKEVFCIAEIKTASVFTAKQFLLIFSEVGLKKYLKTRQMQNLYRYGQHVLANGANRTVLLRLFLIIKPAKGVCLPNWQTCPEPFRLCWKTDASLMLAVTPEYSPFPAQKSLVCTRV